MSYFPNDSLQKQVKRGVVDYVSYIAEPITTADVALKITTGIKRVRLQVEIGASCHTIFTLYDSPTMSVIGGLTPLNMDLAESAYTGVSVSLGDTVSATGTEKAEAEIIDGQNRVESPLTLANGIILDVSTDYLLNIENVGNTLTRFNINMYFTGLD